MTVVIHSCVGGGPMERLVAALEAEGTPAHTERLFPPERWRSLMGRGSLGRAAARLGAMGVFPAKAALRSASRPDRFLVPTTNPFFLPHVLVATGAWHGRRVVPLVYDLYPDAWEAAGVARESSPASRIAVRANELLFRHADAVVFIGGNMARHAISRYGEPRRWAVIETGADRSEFERAEGRLAAKGWEHDRWLQDRVLVTYTGNLGHVHDWVSLAAGLKQAFSDPATCGAIGCLVAASGPGAAFLEKELAGLGEDAVRFVGPLDDEPWAEAMARSEISLVTLGAKAAGTSIPSKTFSAMAAGNALVAVAPEGSDLFDLVKEHDCGIVVAPGDGEGVAAAIARLGREANLRKRLAGNGEKAARDRYDMPVLAARWRAFLGDLEREEPVRLGYEVAKRLIDVAVASSAILGTAPALVPAMAAVRATMGSPVLFRQERPGRNGMPFELMKLRTMRHPRPGEEGAEHDADRLTPLGKLLRATSVDELPTLLNVLRGDMSVVGPRPLLMRYLDRYTPEQARRHEVKPGITGLVQVRGRNALTWERKFELDVEYVDTRCLALDLLILAETALKVVRREGISQEGHATMPEFTGTDQRTD